MGAYVELTDANFKEKVLESDLPVLVDFWASWCVPCRMVGPIVEELATEYAGKAVVGKLDVDANPETAQNYGISSIPSLMMFKGGQKVDEVIGAVPKGKIKSMIDNAL